MSKYRLALLVLCTCVYLVAPERTTAFDQPEHREITATVMRAIRVTIAGRERRFSEPVIARVQAANDSADSIVWFQAALFQPQKHFTDEAFDPSSRELKRLKEALLSDLRARPMLASEAHRKLGTALHAIQDFYSHSNWVELGRPSIETRFGREIVENPLPSVRACPADPNNLGPGGGGPPFGGLTSGYFVGFLPKLGCGALPYFGKCYHGDYTPDCEGINKDKPAVASVAEYDSARETARMATRDFIDLIIQDLRGEERALAGLLGQSTAAFVIDTTDSMAGAITNVKALVSSIVQSAESASIPPPTEWMLLPFNDPGLGPMLVTDSASEFLAAVQAISIEISGGDCPEPSQRAIRTAVMSALPNSVVYTFTDASASDASLGNVVAAEARERNTRIAPVLNGSCSPVDPVYARVARATGGQVFLMRTFELDRLADVVIGALSDDLQTIVSARGVLTEAQREFDVPVDSSVTRLLITVELDLGLTATLVRPNGMAVTSSDSDVKTTVLSQVLIGGSASGTFAGNRPVYTVTAPQQGLWRIRIGGAPQFGSANFSVIAQANSPRGFVHFEFVTRQDGIHGGYLPIQGLPTVNVPATGRALLTQPPADAAFQLVNEALTTFQVLPLTNASGDTAGEFVGTTSALPATPFTIVMNGTDQAGTRIQRQFPFLFRGQPITADFQRDGPLAPLAPASTRSFTVAVSNSGAPAILMLNATTSLGSVRNLTPASVSPGAGEVATATFLVDVPADAEPGRSVELRVTATHSTDPDLYNTAQAQISVAYSDDRDGDAVLDSQDNCPALPNAGQVDSDGDGVGDDCDASNPRSSSTIFDSPPAATYPGPDFTVRAVTDSDGIVSYEYVSGPCALVGGAMFRATGVGSCVVLALTAGNSRFRWSSATQSISIAPVTQVRFAGLDTPWGPPGPGVYNGITYTSGRVFQVNSALPLTFGYMSGTTRIDSRSSRPTVNIFGPLSGCSELDGTGVDMVLNYPITSSSGMAYNPATQTWKQNLKLSSSTFISDECYGIQITDPVTGVTSPVFPIKTK